MNLSAAITDTAGNALTPFASTFTTGSGIDNFQPTILAISPANNAVDVPSTIAITVTFNEPMNPVTINEKTLTLNGPGGVVNASYSMANGNASATLTPLQPLFAGDQYSLTLSTAITDIAGNPLASAVTSSFKTALAPGTTNLPTTATVTVNPGSLFANGQISTTVTISNISAGGVLVPNGTLIAVTADPAFTSSSTGGTISGSSTGSSADPRFQLFSAFGAKVTISYTPPDLTGQGIGTLGSATIQAASVDLDNFPVGLIGSGTVSLFGINSVTISANPTVVPADGSSTSQLSVTVKDVNGNLVPDGTRIALTAAPIFNQVSAGGAILGGTASAADARVKIFTTAGGQFTATYQAPLNPGTGLAVIQVMSIDVGGRPTALVGAASINFPPANDNFSNAQVISGNTGTVNGSNVNASKEAGEPNHAGNAGGKSVWYRWTAPNSGAVSIDTIGSSFDTLLGVYTGSSVSGLTLIASNDNFGGNTTSKVTFTAVGGTVYQIAVDGFSGATGSVTLNWSLTP